MHTDEDKENEIERHREKDLGKQKSYLNPLSGASRHDKPLVRRYIHGENGIVVFS